MDIKKLHPAMLEETHFEKRPDKISKYQVVEELGQGGMGLVYKVFDPQIKMTMALKVISVNQVAESDVKRFIREAKVVAKMSHPNIIKVYDIGIENNSPFYTMSYIDGLSLSAFLEKTPLDIKLFARLMVKISKAIAYAHQQGLIHRDLKPANVMLDKNLEPHVMDFGLVKLAHIESSLSKQGVILGTPQYMSPQQACGEEVDYLADVYSLGAIFYEMLAGRPLVQGDGMANILYKILWGKHDLLRSVNSKLSRDLEAICYKAVAKETRKRYQSAGDFTEDIERFLNGELIIARPICWIF